MNFRNIFSWPISPQVRFMLAGKMSSGCSLPSCSLFFFFLLVCVFFLILILITTGCVCCLRQGDAAAPVTPPSELRGTLPPDALSLSRRTRQFFDVTFLYSRLETGLKTAWNSKTTTVRGGTLVLHIQGGGGIFLWSQDGCLFSFTLCFTYNPILWV